MKYINNIHSLFEKPLWQMTGQEFFELTQYANSQEGRTTTEKVRIVGVHDLAEYLDCCDSTVYMLKRNGVLDDAVISQVGKKIVFDGEKARALADAYQEEQRKAKRGEEETWG